MSSAFSLSRLRRFSNPVIVSMMVIFSISFIIAWVGATDLLSPLILNSWAKPWALVTYPLASGLVSGGIFFFLLTLMYLWTFGTLIEHDLGSKRFLGAFFVATAVGGAIVALGSTTLSTPFGIAGSFFPLSILIVAWCANHPTSKIGLFGLLTMEAKWLALITALLVFFGGVAATPLTSIFTLIPLALGWAWGAGRLPISYTGRRAGMSTADFRQREKRDQDFRDKVRDRKREREERERLRKLFEDSLKDDK